MTMNGSTVCRCPLRTRRSLAMSIHSPTTPQTNQPTPDSTAAKAAAPVATSLPPFDAAVMAKLPNVVSRVAFVDKWLFRRVEQAAAAKQQLDSDLVRLQAAHNGLNAAIDSLSAEVIAATGATRALPAGR